MSLFCIFNQWESNNHHTIYWNTPSFTLIKQTRQPWAVERLVCRRVSRSPFHCQSKQFPTTPQSRTSLRATKPHRRKACVLSGSYVSYLLIHTSVIRARIQSGRAGDELVEVKGQALWRSETESNASTIKSAALLDPLLIVLRSGCHKVM